MAATLPRRSSTNSLTTTWRLTFIASAVEAARGLLLFFIFFPTMPGTQPILEETANAPRDHSKSQAISLGNLALVCIRLRNLDEAATRLNKAIEVIEKTMGFGGLTIVLSASRELRPWRTLPAIDEVHDRFLGLMGMRRKRVA